MKLTNENIRNWYLRQKKSVAEIRNLTGASEHIIRQRITETIRSTIEDCKRKRMTMAEIAIQMNRDDSWVYAQVNLLMKPSKKRDIDEEIDPRSIFAFIDKRGYDDDFEALEPDEPTYEQPGSEAKVEVMRKRVAKGQSAFHPKDKCVRQERTGYGHRDGLQEVSGYSMDHRQMRKGTGGR